MIVDEPNSDLGVLEQHKVLELIRMLRSRGVPVILFTHVMPDALAVSDRIIVIASRPKGWRENHGPHQRRGAGVSVLIKGVLGSTFDWP